MPQVSQRPSGVAACPYGHGNSHLLIFSVLLGEGRALGGLGMWRTTIERKVIRSSADRALAWCPSAGRAHLDWNYGLNVPWRLKAFVVTEVMKQMYYADSRMNVSTYHSRCIIQYF